MLLGRAVAGGFACHVPLETDPAWQAFAGDPAFDALVTRTAAMVAQARMRFDAAGGSDVLRMT
jgi:hypothetical protein